jgi:hypothetical protein
MERGDRVFVASANMMTRLLMQGGIQRHMIETRYSGIVPGMASPITQKESNTHAKSFFRSGNRKRYRAEDLRAVARHFLKRYYMQGLRGSQKMKEIKSENPVTRTNVLRQEPRMAGQYAKSQISKVRSVP